MMRLPPGSRAWKSIWITIFGSAVAAQSFAYTRDLVVAVDTHPDPGIFEMTLIADEGSIDVDGDGIGDPVFAFNGSVPGPLIEVELGDVMIVHFENHLNSLSPTIHWHGIEDNNESDGSPVAQDVVPPGGSFLYQFRVTRPGSFWYHPHVQPSDQTFRGLYGPIVVNDPAEATLTSEGVLPFHTKTIVLSDTTVCQGDASDPDICSGLHCGDDGTEQCEVGDIPFVQPDFDCRNSGPGSSRVELGTSVLVNGIPLGPTDVLDIASGRGLRLRLMNMSILRYFRLLPGAGFECLGSPEASSCFLRIGGQGGLLDGVRLEGGIQSSYDTGFEAGEIVLAPGDRADVILQPIGSLREFLTVAIGDFATTSIPGGLTPAVLRFQIAQEPPQIYSLSAGDALRTHSSVADPVEVLASSGFDDLLDPATEVPGSPLGSNSPIIELQNNVLGSCSSSAECHPGTNCRDDMGDLCPDQSTSDTCACQDDDAGPAIDGVRGIFDLASDDFTQVPHLASSRFARVGDLLELTVSNVTNRHHPFHLHGFSIQPVRFQDQANDPQTLYTFDYAEFIDNIDIKNGESLVFRVRLDDRPTLEDTFSGGQGGAEGRWLFHCHLLHHAALGMISELVVLPGPVFEDGFESGDTSAWSP